MKFHRNWSLFRVFRVNKDIFTTSFLFPSKAEAERNLITCNLFSLVVRDVINIELSCVEILSTMATKCNTCSNPIINTEFISCSGGCGESFHIKCVSVNKSMLNAVNTCPNIHWNCHGCNDGNRNIGASIDRMNEAIALLSSSLSGDLLQFVNNFKVLMNTFVESISTLNLEHSSNGNDLPTVSLIGEGNETSSGIIKSVDRTAQSHGNLAVASNEKQLQFDKQSGTCEYEPMRSVVVSNIGKDISADYLTDYLVNEMNIGRESIKVSVLLPTGKSLRDVNFLQYKVTIPATEYSCIICPDIWPRNVRVRDFVFKTNSNCGVIMQNFLPMKKICSNVNSTS